MSERDFQRHQFGELLRPGGKELPLEFFFGSGHVPGDVGKSATSTISRKDVQWIPLPVVEAIYSFKEFPDGYQDSLDPSSRLKKRQLEKLWLFGERGVYNYHVFRNVFVPIGDHVKALSGPNKGKRMTDKAINQEIPSLSGRSIDQ